MYETPYCSFNVNERLNFRLIDSMDDFHGVTVQVTHFPYKLFDTNCHIHHLNFKIISAIALLCINNG